MEPERWQLIEELYHSASDLPDEQRMSFLRKAFSGDPGLLKEIGSLLGYGSTPQSVPDTPAIAIMAKSLAADEYQCPTPPLEGKTISHHKVIEAIGRGGMGLVYKAEELKLRCQVALKLLPRFLASDRLALQRFQREAQAASALNHPNICTVYEIDESVRPALHRHRIAGRRDTQRADRARPSRRSGDTSYRHRDLRRA
jgi:Protein kinase domain